MIQIQVSSNKPVSMKAEKFSTLPWPYWWSASAGLSDTRIDRIGTEGCRAYGHGALSLFRRFQAKRKQRAFSQQQTGSVLGFYVSPNRSRRFNPCAFVVWLPYCSAPWL